jgi:siroheme synthase (precorrin-2 oxidase/ferrochelatase)
VRRRLREHLERYLERKLREALDDAHKAWVTALGLGRRREADRLRFVIRALEGLVVEVADRDAEGILPEPE